MPDPDILAGLPDKDFLSNLPDQEEKPQGSFLQKLASGYYTTPKTTGEVLGPEFMKVPGMEAAGEWIKNKGINTGNYWGGFIGSALGDLISGGATGFDPRTVGISHAPMEPIPEAVKPPIEVPAPIKREPLALLPAPSHIVNPPRFVGGERGIADVTQANKYDLGANPDVLSGTVLPHEFGSTYEVPPDIAATYSGGIPRTQIPADPSRLIPGDIGEPSGFTMPYRQGVYTGEGTARPGEPQLPSANKFFPDAPATLDEIHSAPKVVTAPEEINHIPPGQADTTPITNGKDIKPFRAEFSSPQVVMENFPQTKSIIQPIRSANDAKYKWLATTERDFAKLSDGLSKQDRQSLWYMMNGEEVPNVNPIVIQRAEQAKKLTDEVWDLAQDKNVNMGFQERYATHIKAMPDDFQSAVKEMWNHSVGKESGIGRVFSSGLEAKPTGDIGDLFEKGLGKPESQFIKPRTGALQDVETDYNRVMPIYLESMAKSIFDRPAVDEATAALKNIPDGKIKNFLQGFIKNYTRYDADAKLAADWNSLAHQIATINARSVISFNPVVHMYHAGQLPANVWPELGTKYSTIGLGKFVSDPIGAYKELVKNGMFSNMIRPMRFQTKMQKFDSVSYYMNLVESIVKGTGYYGFKQKFLDSGMNEAEATMKAISATKDATATIDPARMMRFFTPESNVAGGQMLRLGKQYRQIPTKIIEQFARAAYDWKANPAKAARYVAGSAIAGAGTLAGLHTLHASPLSLIPELGSVSPLGGQFTDVMKNAIKKLSKGDVGGALGDIAIWATPAGTTVKRLLQ